MNGLEKIASWMKAKLENEGYLYQDVVVSEIESAFGEDFVYINENGNLAIDMRVLDAFRSLTEGEVVWDRSERAWRKRDDLAPLSRGVN